VFPIVLRLRIKDAEKTLSSGITWRLSNTTEGYSSTAAEGATDPLELRVTVLSPTDGILLEALCTAAGPSTEATGVSSVVTDRGASGWADIPAALAPALPPRSRAAHSRVKAWSGRVRLRGEGGLTCLLQVTSFPYFRLLLPLLVCCREFSAWKVSWDPNSSGRRILLESVPESDEGREAKELLLFEDRVEGMPPRTAFGPLR